ILAVLNFPLSLMRVPSTGGSPTPIPQAAGQGHHWPRFLPGGRGALLTAAGGRTQERGTDLLVSSSGKWKKIGPGGYGRYLPTGHLLYEDQGILFASAFDLDRLEAGATRVQVWQGLSLTRSGPGFDLSDNGILVYRSGEAALPSVQWIDASGKAQ